MGEIDGDLGVLDPSGGGGVLALHTHRGAALLQIAGFVHDQHRIRLSQVLHHEAAEIVPHSIGIPHCPVQQLLHPARLGVAGLLGQGPAVLARQVGQQAEDELPCSAPWFDPCEPACDAAHEVIESVLPLRRIYAVAHRHRLLFVCPHTNH